MRKIGIDVPLCEFRASPDGEFWYLASPYTNYPSGREAAFSEACAAAGWLLRQKVPVFCPIAHSHSIAVEAGLPLCDYELWLAADAPFMHAAVGLIVADMDGWEESVGVRYEREIFRAQGKTEWLLPRELWRKS